MTDATTSPSTSRKPTHIVYHVRDGKNDDSYWTRIGAAWQHADGKGFNLQVEMYPLDGRLSVRVATEKKG
jgi:hypothetical protein